jgi:YidC/Oxa1 family membrane protein insertase
MEKRAILAAVLMAAILMVYQMLFVSPPPVDQGRGERPGAPGAPVTPAPSVAPLPPPVPAVPPPAAAASVPERTTVVETPLYRARISSTGGAVVEWELKYRGEKPMALPGVVGSRGLEVRRQGGETRPVAFSMSAESVALDKDRPAGQLRLRGEDGFGLQVTQDLRFSVENYLIERTIRVENRHSVAQSAEVEIAWSAPVEWPKEQEGFRGPRPISVVLLAKGVYWARRVWLSDVENMVVDGQWIGYESGVAPVGQNGVYLTALIPKSVAMKVFEAKVEGGGPAAGSGTAPSGKRAQIGVRATLPALQPGQAWEGQILTYLGPMELERLTAVGVNLDKAIYFGGFPFPESWAERYSVPTLPMDWVAVPVLKFMKWLYALVGNYGVAIMVLTIVTKLLFFPLSVKSMKSMKAMQAIQPQVNALRAKYKSDPQRLQRETMELYRQHKVNPLGGCLPMVVQVPIFYALYVALTVSPDLQNSPFVCFGRAPSWIPGLGGSDIWICDLAAHDPTYILPVLMGVSMFIQQKMTPVMGDPRQAKMMLMMPVIFTFMFLNLPSGLVLYWTLSNVLQIAQQYYMDRGAQAARVPARATKKA